MMPDPVALQRQMLMRLMAGQQMAGNMPQQMQPPAPLPQAPTPGQGAAPFQPPMNPQGGRRRQ
jgi:hypothetical protein